DEATKSAFELLSEATSINFIGNIEGRDLLKHGADVVICDGFVGNVMLKLGESIADVLGHFLAAEMKAQDLDEAQRRVVKSVLAGVARRFDYETMGGVPLLGVNGNVIIGHGGSTAAAITQMILRAGELVEHDVANRIAASLA
ncbi:MAG: phosphate acyltransferase, partial [Bacteroidota bacterium]